MTEEAATLGIVGTVIEFFQNGGYFMIVIGIVWAIGMAFAIERFIKLAMRYDVDGASFMNELQRYILANDIQGAIRACSGSMAMLPKVLKSGLKRSGESTDQIQNAIDATALEVIPKVEKRIGHLGVIANISTLFGLLGTIQGLIVSFASISQVEPTQKAEALANGVAKAMNTTFLGLLSAISLMVLHTYLTSKSEKIVAEIDEFSVKLLDLIGTKKMKDK